MKYDTWVMQNCPCRSCLSFSFSLALSQWVPVKHQLSMGLRLSLPVSAPKIAQFTLYVSLSLSLFTVPLILSLGSVQCTFSRQNTCLLTRTENETSKQSAESHLHLNKYCWSNCKSEQFFSSRATIKVFARGVRCSTCSHHQLIPSGDNYTHTHTPPSYTPAGL